MENIKYESIEGKNVVITGASGGIGEALSDISVSYTHLTLPTSDLV